MKQHLDIDLMTANGEAVFSFDLTRPKAPDHSWLPVRLEQPTIVQHWPGLVEQLPRDDRALVSSCIRDISAFCYTQPTSEAGQHFGDNAYVSCHPASKRLRRAHSVGTK